MEINGNNSITKKDLYTNKKERNAKIKTRENSGDKTRTGNIPDNANEDIKEIQTIARKSILRSQAIIGGLENFRELSNASDNPAEKIVILQDVISKTVLDNKQVLQEYETLMHQAISSNNPETINQLIRQETANIQHFSSELGKHAIKEQNIMSLDSSLDVEDPEALLREVIRQLREEGEPQMNLPHSRVLDLLGE